MFGCFSSTLQAQVLSVAPDSGFNIKSGTVISADGLDITPSTDFSLNTSLSRSASVNSSPAVININRGYQFGATTAPFSGVLQINYLDSELNELVESDLKLLYKTCWEMSMKSLIDQSAGRGPFIDQTQSLNLFMASPTFKKLTSMHFYAWKSGLKTGIYYLRSKAGSSSGKFSVDPELEKRINEKRKNGIKLEEAEQEAVLMCSLDDPESCALCSS